MEQISPDIVGSAFDAVLQISGAVAAVVDTPEYLKCLWKVCLQEAERKGIRCVMYFFFRLLLLFGNRSSEGDDPCPFPSLVYVRVWMWMAG